MATREEIQNFQLNMQLNMLEPVQPSREQGIQIFFELKSLQDLLSESCLQYLPKSLQIGVPY